MKHKNAYERYCLIDKRIRYGDYPNTKTLLLFVNKNAGVPIKRRTLENDLKELRNPDNYFLMPVAFCNKRNGFFYTNDEYILDHHDLLNENKFLKEQLKNSLKPQ